LSYNIIVVSAFYLIVIINENENEKSDWIIKPIARANYYKLALEILIVSRIILNMDESIFNTAMISLNVVISIHFIYHLINFSNKKYLKNKPNIL
jgi:hypothetical protein